LNDHVAVPEIPGRLCRLLLDQRLNGIIWHLTLSWKNVHEVGIVAMNASGVNGSTCPSLPLISRSAIQTSNRRAFGQLEGGKSSSLAWKLALDPKEARHWHRKLPCYHRRPGRVRESSGPPPETSDRRSGKVAIAWFTGDEIAAIQLPLQTSMVLERRIDDFCGDTRLVARALVGDFRLRNRAEAGWELRKFSKYSCPRLHVAEFRFGRRVLHCLLPCKATK
jgi:hypothetical protein